VLQVFTVSLPHLAGHDVGAGDRAAGSPTEHPGEPVLRRLTGRMTAVLVPVLAVGALALHRLVPVVFGGEFERATGPFVPALALVALAPLSAMLVQVAALRLRPEIALESALAGALIFLLVASVAVPAWGAAGGTAAPLAGATATAVVATVRLRGAVTPVLAGATFGGTTLVAVLGLTTHLGAPW
jgi:O-antigen/teichoic acid export membrane protein